MDARTYERELRPLLRQAAAFAHSILRNRADAEDAVQQAALRAWERIDRFDPSKPFKGWWFAVLRNCAIDARRRRLLLRTESIEGVDLAAQPAPEDAHVDAIDTAIARLSEMHREVLQLKYFGELSYDEIAEALAVPRGTVMSRLHLARKALATLVVREDV